MSVTGWESSYRQLKLTTRLRVPEAVERVVGLLRSSDWTVTTNPLASGVRVAAVRWKTCTSTLEPIGGEGRRRMGAWSLLERFPPGVDRHFRIEVDIRYLCTAWILQSASGTVFDATIAEEIDPAGHVVPDTSIFSVATRLSENDPSLDLAAVLAPSAVATSPAASARATSPAASARATAAAESAHGLARELILAR